MKQIGTKRIETNRLILRRFALEDAADMFRNWVNDAEVCTYFRGNPMEILKTQKQYCKAG